MRKRIFGIEHFCIAIYKNLPMIPYNNSSTIQLHLWKINFLFWCGPNRKNKLYFVWGFQKA